MGLINQLDSPSHHSCLPRLEETGHIIRAMQIGRAYTGISDKEGLKIGLRRGRQRNSPNAIPSIMATNGRAWKPSGEEVLNELPNLLRLKPAASIATPGHSLEDVV